MSDWIGLPYLIALVAIVTSVFISFRRPPLSNGTLLDYTLRSQESVVKALEARVKELEYRASERELDLQGERQAYENYIEALDTYGDEVCDLARRCLEKGETLPVRPRREQFWRKR